MGKATLQYLLTGILFAALWASASSAGKFGLQSAEGLVLFSYRFIIAGIVLLAYATLIQKDRLPIGKEWRQLLVFALFNTALYLGVFIVALEEVTAGITTIALALNPLLISSMTSLWTRRPITLVEWLSLFIGIVGVILAAYPLLLNSHATLFGLILLGSCMIFYSFGSVYYATIPWKLSRTAINGWQVLLGGLMLIPFAVFFHSLENQFDFRFWFSIGWLVLPVSVGAVQLWLYLLKTDAVRASLWLFLCPIFGLLYAAWLLAEPVTSYTIAGLVLVLLALILGQRPVVPKVNKA
jgi:drug/metabolite transporter (DMT)-like permease